MIADSRRAIETLSRLQAMGVHLSVDDFGTGYSSLTYLSRLPVDQLKVDTRFVERLQDSSRDRAIVKSIISLGHHLGLEWSPRGSRRRYPQRAAGTGLRRRAGVPVQPPAGASALPAFLDAQPVLAAAVPPSPRDGSRDRTLDGDLLTS